VRRDDSLGLIDPHFNGGTERRARGILARPTAVVDVGIGGGHTSTGYGLSMNPIDASESKEMKGDEACLLTMSELLGAGPKSRYLSTLRKGREATG